MRYRTEACHHSASRTLSIGCACRPVWSIVSSASARVYAQHGGKRTQQRIELVVGLEVAADESRERPPAAVSHEHQALCRRLRIDFADRHGRELGFARHHMLVATRKDDDVTSLD